MGDQVASVVFNGDDGNWEKVFLQKVTERIIRNEIDEKEKVEEEEVKVQFK